MSSRKTIAIDIDDVLSSQVRAIIAFSNEKYGTSLVWSDFQKKGPFWGYWEQVWGVDEKEGKRRLEEFFRDGYQSSQPLMPYVIGVLRKLEKNYHLVVVTSRQDTDIEETHQWLDHHFPKIFKQVEFVQAWSGDRKTSKAIICKEIGAAYLIDDSLEHCRLAAEEGIQSLLFGEYGWNRAKKLPSNVSRVKDWREVEAYFEHATSQ